MGTSSKFVLFFSFALVITIGSLWFVGGKKYEYSTTTTIDAKPREVFPYLSDPERLMKWVDGWIEIDSQVEGPFEFGAQAQILIEEGGKQVAMQLEVIKYGQDSMIAIQNKNDAKVSTLIFRLESQSFKTQLSYKVKEARTGLNRITSFFGSDGIQERIKEDVRRLKQMIENDLKNGTLSPSPTDGDPSKGPDRQLPSVQDDSSDDSTAKNDSETKTDANASDEAKANEGGEKNAPDNSDGK